MGPTKGTHIVVRRFAGMSDVACYAEARSDGRPFFILPWNGLVLIGTTDTRCDADPASVHAEESEIAYLLAEAAHVFPRAELKRDSVLYAYSGLRPLPRQGLRETAAITRRHQIRHHGRTARGLYSVIGGKITTYRHLAEEAVDQLVQRLGIEAAPCTTAELALPGGGGDRAQLLAELARVPGLAACQPGTPGRCLWRARASGRRTGGQRSGPGRGDLRTSAGPLPPKSCLLCARSLPRYGRHPVASLHGGFRPGPRS